MKFNKYIKKIAKISNYPPEQKVILPTLFIAEEAGEVVHEVRRRY